MGTNQTERPNYDEGSVPSGYETWNPGRVNHSDPCKKVPTGYLPPGQSKSGKKTPPK